MPLHAIYWKGNESDGYSSSLFAAEFVAVKPDIRPHVRTACPTMETDCQKQVLLSESKNAQPQLVAKACAALSVRLSSKCRSLPLNVLHHRALGSSSHITIDAGGNYREDRDSERHMSLDVSSHATSRRSSRSQRDRGNLRSTMLWCTGNVLKSFLLESDRLETG